MRMFAPCNIVTISIQVGKLPLESCRRCCHHRFDEMSIDEVLERAMELIKMCDTFVALGNATRMAL